MDTGHGETSQAGAPLVVAEYELAIEAGQVRRFAEAAWDADPRYQPGSGVEADRVPPTYLGAAATLCGREHSLLSMGFDVARAFHGSELIQVHLPFAAGATLRVEESVHALSDVHGARGGRMRRALRRLRFFGDSGVEVAMTERVILETDQVRAVAPPATGDLGLFDDGLELRRDPVRVGPVRLEQLGPGDHLPSASFGPVTRTDFVRYAAASGDLTAIHFDEHAARSHGYPAPFAMGMFSAALMGHVLTDWLDPAPPWSLYIRFVDIVWPGESLTVSGTVAQQPEAGWAIEIDCLTSDRLVTKAWFSMSTSGSA
jgi:acyl dehydratase